MAAVQQTQDYLSEAKAPSVITPDAVTAAVAAFVGEGAKASQEAAKLAQLLQAAEIAEGDIGLRNSMEEGFQKIGALQRETGEAEAALRRVVQILREFSDWDARFRSAAQPLGYTI